MTSYAYNVAAFQPGSSLGRTFSDGTSQTILLGERVMLCGSVFNPWYESNTIPVGPFPGFLASNLGTPAATCNPFYPSSAQPGFTLVCLADGSGRGVSAQAATAVPAVGLGSANNWAVALSPAKGDLASSEW